MRMQWNYNYTMRSILNIYPTIIQNVRQCSLQLFCKWKSSRVLRAERPTSRQPRALGHRQEDRLYAYIDISCSMCLRAR